MDIILSGIFERIFIISIYNWVLKFHLSTGCKIILLEKYTNMLCYNLCLNVLAFTGHFDEYVPPVHGGWADNEKTGQKN